MEITYYTRETAPHLPVELGSRVRRSYSEPLKEPCPSDVHSPYWGDKSGPEAKPELAACTCWSDCAACTWDDHTALRAKKRAQVRTYQRTGKFPKDWLKPTDPWRGMLKWKPLTLAQAKRIVLPDCGDHKAKGCKCQNATWKDVGVWLDCPENHEIDGDPRARYLEAMGSKYESTENGPSSRWSCGCTTQTACARHKWALEGREED